MPSLIRSLLLVVVFHTAAQATAPPPMLRDAHGDPLPPGAVARYGTVRLRHAGALSAAFIRDGKHLLSWSKYDGLVHELRLWEVTTGKLLQRRRLTTLEQPRQVAFSPTGDLFIAYSDGIDEVKGLIGDRKRFYDQVEDFYPEDLQVSPDGKKLAVMAYTDCILFDIEKRKKIGSLDIGKRRGGLGGSGYWPPLSCSFSPDGKFLALSTTEGAVDLWEVEKRKKLYSYPGSRNFQRHHSVRNWSFSPDGRFFVASPSHMVRLFTIPTPREVEGFISPPDQLLATQFSEEGKQLRAIDPATGKIRRYETMTGMEESNSCLPFTTYEVIQHVAFSPNRQFACLVGRSNLFLTDLKTGKSQLPQLGDRIPLRRVRWSSRHEIVSQSINNRVIVWDPRSGSPVRAHGMEFKETLLDVDRKGQHALQLSDEGHLQLLRLSDNRVLWKNNEYRPNETSASFSPDGRWVIQLSREGTQIVNARDGKVVRRWSAVQGDEFDRRSLARSADGRMVALLEGSANTVTMRDFATDRVRSVLEVTKAVRIALCPKGQHLAVIRRDQLIQVYRLGETRPRFEVVVRGIPPTDERHSPAHPLVELPLDRFPKAAFTPDGRHLAAGCGEAVRFWDMNGAPAGSLRGHDDTILDLAFEQDGHRLVTSSADGTALVWDVRFLSRPAAVKHEEMPQR